ncbi:P1 family peptidase [Brevibacillus ginsengisoli]|uniref:DmpA family aminopeptidase n=1 Tax=Brevibacillus ginsengisoli TaxID=363854 RepID=UPI003CF9BA19
METRYRLRELGIHLGKFETSKLNSITDVEGVQVGHRTLSYELEDGKTVRTGVTAVLPHPGNLFQDKVLGSCYVINGFGKTVGTVQLQEFGVIESPIMLTNTLSVPAVSEGTIRYLLEQNEDIGTTTGTVNVIVGECNDGFLNDIRGMHVKPEDAYRAIQSAQTGVVAEGCVGAGTGMSCLGYKGGIGTSSRVTSLGSNAYTVGALVVSNFGAREDLLFRGKKVEVPKEEEILQEKDPDGSIMIIMATDAPVNERQLHRIAKRAAFGLSRTGSFAAHGSGDVVISFSTAHRIPHYPADETDSFSILREDGEAISQLFEMTVEAVEEAIWNSLCKATTTVGQHGKIKLAISYDVLRNA